ncbi:MAG: DUF2125 domain-containing protein [Aliishimia sp.]
MSVRTASVRKIISYSTISVALSVGAAQADVTGAGVWGDWQEYMLGFGYSLSGNESQSGDTLNVSDIAMTIELPEDAGIFTMTIGDMSFLDNSNGTVTVGLPAVMPLTFDIAPDGGDPVKGTINYTQTAPVMIVSGDEGDFTYTYSAESVSMDLGELIVDGVPMPAEMFAMNMTMRDISNTTRTTVGDLRGYDSKMSVSAISYDVSFDVPDGPEAGKGSFKGEMSDLTMSADAEFAKDLDATDPAGMLAAGMNVTSSFEYKSGSGEMDVVSPDGPVTATTSSRGGNLESSLTPEGLRYAAEQSGLKVKLQASEFPFPIELEMEKSGFVFGMPLAASQEPQDFSFGFTLGDFTISDSIWGLFDAAGQLPRDPATLALDLTGKARLFANLFDPESMNNAEIPGEVNALDINNLIVSAVGAEITAKGGFTFDNSDFSTFDGVPRPEGAVDVVVKGANGLIDKLINMGLLPQEQAMGARMMMGLFGVAQGDDTVTSKIEVNEKGNVFANGQQLR